MGENAGRDPRRGRWLDLLSQDVRLGWRQLRRSPGFAAAAVLMLAVGIGANAAIFSVVDAVLLRPLPYANPHDLVWMYCKRSDRAKAPFSIADLEDYQRQARGLDAIAAFSTWGANLTGAGVAERIQGIRITGNFLATLGARPFLGRGVEPADDLPEAQPTVVLTYGFWQRQLGADRAAIGRTVLLNGRRYTVTGVLPRGFFFPQRDAEIASAAVLGADSRRADRGDRFLRVIGRLRPGVSATRAETELTALAERLQRLYPATNDKNVGVRALPMDQEIIGDLRFALRILAGAVGVLLLLSCANLGHLLLMRFSARRHELAVRLALGATPGGLARQMLVESCLLAGAGAVLGILSARACIPLLLRLSPQRLPDAGAIGVDSRLLLFIATISVMAVMIFGLWPALRASRRQPREAIKAPGPQAGGAASEATTRQVLIALEAGLAVVLLTGAGLFAKSFARLAQVNPGFAARGVIVMKVSLPPERYQAPPAVTTFQQRLAQRLATLPGVHAV
ncbi:MAG TPA: ABC transporter permease, partial [Thermoanaerobaculia bacterium]|nr:ABC transporter permease [Thermoanaerobaculia bacterium]